MRTGVLLVNLGTPENPSVPAVRRYLHEFLMDPLVIDIPWIARAMLIHGYILRTRPALSAAAYEKIWTDRGSPLRYHTLDLAEGVQREMGADFVVKVAMRYGSPSIRDGVAALAEAQVERWLVAPLYPQYSLAATESSLRKVREEARRHRSLGEPAVLPPFYDEPEFLDAFVQSALPSLQSFGFDHVLFSFHGLPERQVKRTDETGRFCMSSPACCSAVVTANSSCYRAQCFSTARGLAERLGLPQSQYTVSFQSRLGRTPWIRPFTDELLQELPRKGVRRIAVFCPSFVADCLETLEEIEIRGKQSFVDAGGESLFLIPSLNSGTRWASALGQLVRGTLGSPAEAR